jgi:autotransporter passenger strand-loop-strand repeat protein
VISSGGYQYDAATAINATVLGGGEQDVYSTASNTTVSSGGLLLVESGGVANSATISSGGEVLIDGGTFSGALLGGAVEVDEVVSSGSTISAETITSGLIQTVLSGGQTVSVAITAVGEQNVSGGTTTGTSVLSGGIQNIYSGTASGTVISSGGYQYDAGTAIGATVLSGGEQDVDGTASNTTVSSGGIEIVESGGNASNTTVQSGGEIVVYAGATVSGLVLDGGSEVFVSSGGHFPAAAVEESTLTAQASDRSSDPGPALSASLSSAPLPAPVELTVANLIQAMARYDAGTVSKGALFESVSGGLLDEHSAALAANHHALSHH